MIIVEGFGKINKSGPSLIRSQLVPCTATNYSHLHNSVNTEISFFGRDVTYLPKKHISHVLMAMLMALDNDTQQ